jgi:hypothetical protein
MLTGEFTKIEEPNVWDGSGYADRRDYALVLTDEMVTEIDCALKTVMAKEIPPRQITKENFRLAKSATFLEAAYQEIENGRGFAVLSGWPVDRYGYEENVAAFCGIAAYLGKIVVQNYEGESIVDVRDEGVPYSHLSRGNKSNKLLPFHTDGSDLVGLLCLGQATRGGLSLIVSATKVYNTILEERPEYLKMLHRGFFHHRRRQHAEGEPPISESRIPVFTFSGGYLHCCYNRNPIDWVEKEGMTLSNEEKAALDYFDSVVARPELQLKLEFKKGDIQLLNNFAILHSRTEFESDEHHQRHLVRLWLEDPRSKRIGESLLDLYVPGISRFHAAG